MATQLWLLRHGDADPQGTGPDAARELTRRGREQARAAGAALRALEVDLGAAFTSPKVRARQTAELACAELGVDPLAHEPLAGGFDAAEARALLAAQDAGARTLIVGHEPDFSLLVHDLTGARVALKKGGLAAIRLDGAERELIALLRPRELVAIAAR